MGKSMKGVELTVSQGIAGGRTNIAMALTDRF
jgi:hypothetical protein